MLSIEIPYPKTDTIFGEICYPGLVDEVWLASTGYQPFEFILDSGADCTMVPRYMANLVGIKFSDSPDSYVRGITSRAIPIYKGQLRLRIEGEEFEVRCLFTKSKELLFFLGGLISFQFLMCTSIIKMVKLSSKD